MNTSSNQSAFYLTRDQWLAAFGSTWSLDIFMSYPYMIASILGFILNAYSLVVFQDAEFNTALYKYLRVYCLNNMAVCLSGTGNMFFATKRVFPWSNSFYTQAYSGYFHIPMMNVLNFNGSMIDIYILLDRIANFNKRVKTWINWSVYKTCFITLIACSLFNLPSFLAYCPASVTFMLNATTPFSIWYTGTTGYFGGQLVGAIWLAFFLVVRDFGIMVAQLAFNLYSIVLLKRYLEKKRALHNRVSPGTATVDAADGGGISMYTATAITRNNDAVTKRGEEEGTSRTVVGRRKEKISAADQKATVMAIVMCFLSVTEHLLFLTAQIIPYFQFDLTIFVFFALTNFFWSLKRCMDFPVFFFFNNNFKRVCLRHLRA